MQEIDIILKRGLIHNNGQGLARPWSSARFCHADSFHPFAHGPVDKTIRFDGGGGRNWGRTFST